MLTQSPTLNQYFRNHGYYTAGAGKIYHYEQVDTAGWVDYFPSKTKPMPDDNFPPKRPANMPPFKYIYNMFDWSPLDIEDESTGDFQSVKYITEQLSKKHDKPFFLACGIYRPHHPWYVPQKYFDMFPLDSIKLPRLIEDDTTDLGVFARKEIIERGGNYHRHVVQGGQWKKAIQGYLASLAFSDAMTGKLLQALSESEYAENTIVVIWSDHGWQLGEKNHWRKFALWENVTRTVLMIQVPKGVASLPEGSKSGRSMSLVSLLDLYPTLAELCSLPKRTDLDGTSLLPLLNDPSLIVDRPIITTYDYGSYSVRYKNWHYIKYIDDSKELYDLNADPEEWQNIADKEDQRETISLLDGFIPKTPADFPVESLIPLLEHHIAPIQSRAHYESKERREWMKRFENIP
jgi:arylsulfatase A-like enzyme